MVKQREPSAEELDQRIDPYFKMASKHLRAMHTEVGETWKTLPVVDAHVHADPNLAWATVLGAVVELVGLNLGLVLNEAQASYRTEVTEQLIRCFRSSVQDGAKVGR